MDQGPKVTGSNVPLWLLAMFAAKRKLKAEAVGRGSSGPAEAAPVQVD